MLLTFNGLTFIRELNLTSPIIIIIKIMYNLIIEYSTMEIFIKYSDHHIKLYENKNQTKENKLFIFFF